MAWPPPGRRHPRRQPQRRRRRRVEWLNERTDDNTSFFGVVVEVLKIDDSKPAYNFKLVVFPNEWQRGRKRTAQRTVTRRGEAYLAFYQPLIDELREQHRFTGARRAQPQNWSSFASGFSGINYATAFTLGDRVRVELYIDRGDEGENQALFDWLHARREQLEDELGEPLEWEQLEGKRACRIAVYRHGSIQSSDDDLTEIRAWMVERLIRMEAVLTPLLKAFQARQS